MDVFNKITTMVYTTINELIKSIGYIMKIVNFTVEKIDEKK